jgi:membrane protein
MGSVLDRLKAAIAAVRARSGFVDHAARMIGRFNEDRGNNLASVITLPAFLSFFPLVALALSVAGYVAHYDHSAQKSITDAIAGYFPGLIGSKPNQINIATISAHRTATGVVGLIGLLLGGLGWIDSLRQTLRDAWHQPQLQANFFLVKARDVLVLVFVGLAALLSLSLTALATAAASNVVRHTPLPEGGATKTLLQVLALVIAVGGNALLFAVLFTRLPDTRGQGRQIATGVLFGAIGLEILKTAGVYYISRTTGNALYASFAVVIGLLVWVNLIARLFIYAAVWAVTGPYDSDVPPSGTAPLFHEMHGAPAMMPAAALDPRPDPASGVAPAAPDARGARLAGTATLSVLSAGTALVVLRGWRTFRQTLGSPRP